MRACEDKADYVSVRTDFELVVERARNAARLGALYVEVFGVLLNHRWLDASRARQFGRTQPRLLVSYTTLARPLHLAKYRPDIASQASRGHTTRLRIGRIRHTSRR